MRHLTHSLFFFTVLCLTVAAQTGPVPTPVDRLPNSCPVGDTVIMGGQVYNCTSPNAWSKTTQINSDWNASSGPASIQNKLPFVTDGNNVALPAGAFLVGNVALNQSGAISGTIINYPQGQGITAFGDSIAGGTGATNAGTKGFVAIVGSKIGGTVHNYAHGGDASADTVHVLYAESNPGYGDPVYLYETGANEGSGACGYNAACKPNFTNTVRASLAWLAIPNTSKVFGQSCSTTGSWTPDNSLHVGMAIKTTTAGGAITCTLPKASPVIYLAYRAFSGGNSSASLSINAGATTDTLKAFGNGGTSLATANGATDTVFANRYVVSSASPTSFTITVTAASTTYPFSFAWAGVALPPIPDQSNASSPRVLAIGTPYLPYISTWNDPANIAAPFVDVGTVARELANDGLNVAYVNTRAFMNVATDHMQYATTAPNGIVCPATMAWPWHPNDCGHAHIADAIMTILSQGSSARTQMAGSSATSSGNCASFDAVGNTVDSGVPCSTPKVMSYYISGNPGASAGGHWQVNLGTAITVLRVTAVSSSGSPVGCSTFPTVGVWDGSNTATVTFPSGTGVVDSGPLSVNLNSATLKDWTVPAVGCSTNIGNVMVTVVYK